jgi:FkbM family methyltransferase
MTIKSTIRRALQPIMDPLAGKWFRHRLSYSAAGEDRIVLAWLEVVYRLDLSKVRYLDIGANHPTELSNTFLLYRLCASGVLVEPDPDLCAALKNKRRRDTVLNVGAAFDVRRSARLKRLTARAFNTFSAEKAHDVTEASKNWKPDQRQAIVDEIDVKLVPINDILAEHFSTGVDFISIDTEGVDMQILQSIDFNRYKPKMVCVENSRPQNEFVELLSPFGYGFVAITPDNLIFRLF